MYLGDLFHLRGGPGTESDGQRCRAQELSGGGRLRWDLRRIAAAWLNRSQEGFEQILVQDKAGSKREGSRLEVDV